MISYLGMHYAKESMFEKAIYYFTRASQVEPREAKWNLMIAGCYQRMNLLNEALTVYEEVHDAFPESIECVRGLIQIRKELKMGHEVFSEKLVRLERGLQQQIALQQNQYCEDHQPSI